MESEGCPICFDDKNEMTTLPCGHVFCLDCMLTWFDQTISCPLCRSDPVAMQKYNEYKKRYKPRYLRTGRRHKVNHRK